MTNDVSNVCVPVRCARLPMTNDISKVCVPVRCGRLPMSNGVTNVLDTQGRICDVHGSFALTQALCVLQNAVD